MIPSEILGEKVRSAASIGGGCIGNSSVVETVTGKRYFLKQYARAGVSQAEAIGLKELASCNAIRTPSVISVDSHSLLLEYIERGHEPDSFQADFGMAFAKLHRFSATSFGFDSDNFIGETVQRNHPRSDSWQHFYLEERLQFQVNLCKSNGYADTKLLKTFDRIRHLLPELLAHSEEAPSLLHGDLWSGNYLCDEFGSPVLIDPAVYYGHREADLAMTKLFGGFTRDFYSAYNEEFPLQSGWKERENIYKLYHILNHLNLFGHSYYNQALELMKYYL